MDLNTRLFPYLDGPVFRVVLYNEILVGYAVKWSFSIGSFGEKCNGKFG